MATSPPTGSSTGGGGSTGGDTGGDWPSETLSRSPCSEHENPNVRIAMNNLPVEYAILFSTRAIGIKQKVHNQD
jgi:hypothetical protein